MGWPTLLQPSEKPEIVPSPEIANPKNYFPCPFAAPQVLRGIYPPLKAFVGIIIQLWDTCKKNLVKI
jgi:hypothetical protein